MSNTRRTAAQQWAAVYELAKCEDCEIIEVADNVICLQLLPKVSMARARVIAWRIMSVAQLALTEVMRTSIGPAVRVSMTGRDRVPQDD